MRRAVALLAMVTSVLVGGCEATQCTPTKTAARDALKVDLETPTGSAVLHAVLTAKGRGLSGKPIRFDVTADGDSVYNDDAATSAIGAASLDLKRVDAGALGGLARGDGFRASFAGDATYCSSADDAAFKLVRAPGGDLPAG